MMLLHSEVDNVTDDRAHAFRCVVPARNTIHPDDQALKSILGIPGIPDARFWGDEWPNFSRERLETFTDSDFRREYSGVYDKPHSYLAISGGGANGAFGAGLLVG